MFNNKLPPKQNKMFRIYQKCYDGEGKIFYFIKLVFFLLLPLLFFSSFYGIVIRILTSSASYILSNMWIYVGWWMDGVDDVDIV